MSYKSLSTPVLLAALATVVALLVRGRLFPGFSGRTPATQPGVRVTDDRFVLVLGETSAQFDLSAVNRLLQEFGVLETEERLVGRGGR